MTRPLAAFTLDESRLEAERKAFRKLLGPDTRELAEPRPGRPFVLRDRETQGAEAAMKYFTPELVVAYGSDDPATWKAAEARWDDACARYAAYVASVKDRLPADLRQVEDTYRLHDAVVRGMGRRGKAFVLV